MIGLNILFLKEKLQQEVFEGIAQLESLLQELGNPPKLLEAFHKIKTHKLHLQLTQSKVSLRFSHTHTLSLFHFFTLLSSLLLFVPTVMVSSLKPQASTLNPHLIRHSLSHYFLL